MSDPFIGARLRARRRGLVVSVWYARDGWHVECGQDSAVVPHIPAVLAWLDEALPRRTRKGLGIGNRNASRENRQRRDEMEAAR